MQAKVTNPAGYRCAPNGAIVVVFQFGEVISGQVAEWAVDEGAARVFTPVSETKIAPPPETKRGRRK